MSKLFTAIERNPVFQLIICLIGWYYLIGCFAKVKELPEKPDFELKTPSDKICYSLARIIRNGFCKVSRLINKNKVVKIISTIILAVGMVYFLQTLIYK